MDTEGRDDDWRTDVVGWTCSSSVWPGEMGLWRCDVAQSDYQGYLHNKTDNNIMYLYKNVLFFM